MRPHSRLQLLEPRTIERIVVPLLFLTTARLALGQSSDVTRSAALNQPAPQGEVSESLGNSEQSTPVESNASATNASATNASATNASATDASATDAAPVQPAVPAAQPSEPIEVTIQGDSRPAGTTTITRSDARNLAGAFGDGFRALEAQPGISPVASGLPYFFIRGAPPGNVGYLVDGVRIPMLFHAFVGPAVLHPAMIERTTVYRGAYPASIGRFAGGVVDAETQHPGGPARAELGVRLFDAGAMLASPFADGRGHIAIGGRYSYTALLLSLLVLDNTRLEYWDYQTRADYAVSKNSNLTLLAFGAHDLSGSTTANSLTSMDFHRIDARYDVSLNDDTRINTGVTLGYDRTRTEEDSSLKSWSLGARTRVTRRFGSKNLVVTGGDVLVEDYHSGLTSALQLQGLTGSGRDISAGVFLESPWYPTPAIAVTPGLRVDFFGGRGRSTLVGVDPRITGKLRLSEAVQVVHSFGVVHQRPTFMPAALPAFQGASDGLGLQRSIQASSGVELLIPFDCTLSLTAFDNFFSNLTDPLGTSGELNPNTARIRALGSAVGLEVYLQRPIAKGLGGFLAYTLSRSSRSHDQIGTPSAFDRTHVATAALSYDLGRRFRIGTRLTGMSGVPTRKATTAGPIFDDGHRARAFYRLDARLEKRWQLSDTAWWALVFELLNASASQEVVRRTCNQRICQQSIIGPIVLPSVGVEAAF